MRIIFLCVALVIFLAALLQGPYDKLINIEEQNGTKIVTWKRSLSDTLILENPVYIECVHFSKKPSDKEVEEIAKSRYDEQNPKILSIMPHSICFYSAYKPNSTYTPALFSNETSGDETGQT